MEFMTTEYVAEQAKLGEIPALECSWEHHHQGETAPKGELIGAIEDKRFTVGDEFCACCIDRHLQADCDKCPLNGPEEYILSHCCNGLWKKVELAFIAFKADYSNINFDKFQKTEGTLCTYIEGVLERKKAEQAEDNSDKFCWDCKHTGLQSTKAPCCDCMIRSRPKWEPIFKKESKPALDYSKAIIATKEGQSLLILVPNCDTKSYEIVGYDWLRLSDGKFNSCCCWNTPEEAVECYRKTGYNVVNHIFDDLALRAEDLEEFEIAPQKGDSGKLRASIDKCGDFWFDLRSANQCMGIDRIVQFHQELGQMIATAKRKQKSK